MHKYLTNAPNARIGKVTSKKSRKIINLTNWSRGSTNANTPTATAMRMISDTKTFINIFFSPSIKSRFTLKPHIKLNLIQPKRICGGSQVELEEG